MPLPGLARKNRWVSPLAGAFARAFRVPRAALLTGTAAAGALAALIGDVEKKIFDRLPDETWVYPGHGDDTTLGAERPHLDEWQARGW